MPPLAAGRPRNLRTSTVPTGIAQVIAAIVGGFNQVRGALAGGLIVGVIDSLAAAYISTSYRLAVPLVLLVIIILVKPEGLFGRKEERRV